MSTHKQSLELQREKLLDVCVKNTQNLQHIQELLRKADSRRATEGGDARKWNKILENLEHSLDGAKARLELSRLDLQRIEKEIDRLNAEETGAKAHNPSGDAQQKATQDAQDLVSVGAIEPEKDAAGQQKRTHFVLRSAILKIQSHRIDEMTAPEIQTVQVCYRNLLKMNALTPKNERLKHILSAAIKTLEHRGQERPA